MKGVICFKSIVVIVLVFCFSFLMLYLGCGKKSTKQTHQLISSCSTSSTSLDFGTITPGQSKDTSFVISNDGETVLSGSIDKNALDLGCLYFFITSGQGSYSLNPGQSKTIGVRFAPPDYLVFGKTYECYILTGNSICGDVNCIGKAEVPTPSCSLSTNFLDFGTVKVDTMVTKTFTIYNTSTNGAVLSGEVKPDALCAGVYYDFVILSGGGSYSLSPGQSRQVIVGFNPQGTGYYNCTIYPDYYVLGSRYCGDVTCTGRGQ